MIRCQACGVAIAAPPPLLVGSQDLELAELRALVARLQRLNESLGFQLAQCRRALEERFDY